MSSAKINLVIRGDAPKVGFSQIVHLIVIRLVLVIGLLTAYWQNLVEKLNVIKN